MSSQFFFFKTKNGHEKYGSPPNRLRAQMHFRTITSLNTSWTHYVVKKKEALELFFFDYKQVRNDPKIFSYIFNRPSSYKTALVSEEETEHSKRNGPEIPDGRMEFTSRYEWLKNWASRFFQNGVTVVVIVLMVK